MHGPTDVKSGQHVNACQFKELIAPQLLRTFDFLMERTARRQATGTG